MGESSGKPRKLVRTTNLPLASWLCTFAHGPYGSLGFPVSFCRTLRGYMLPEGAATRPRGRTKHQPIPFNVSMLGAWLRCWRICERWNFAWKIVPGREGDFGGPSVVVGTGCADGCWKSQPRGVDHGAIMCHCCMNFKCEERCASRCEDQHWSS